MTAPHPLPIDTAIPALREALALGRSAVLQAPPGAGKSTGVPLALLEDSWLGGRRILMLEPRRLAARAVARRMAQMLGDEVGGVVGYRVRHDVSVSARTRIEVVTEGILTRLLLADPTLDNVGLVLFDEFHERSIHADIGLALALHTRRVLREDLRLAAMSATLDDVAVAGVLGGALVITSPGRAFPVETLYAPPRSGTRLEVAVAGAVRTALLEHEGDLLVFLPGAGEIRRTQALLDAVGADVIALHGTLPPAEQDRAIRPSPAGRRKVVLATSIAETSLTIEGIRVVVDSGWARVPRYSPRTGMTSLATVRVSLGSADQRRGRAGRLSHGVCIRLWAESEEAGFPARARPEILEADLAPLALDLAAAGIREPAELSWIDPPPEGAYQEARSLLRQLGALDRAGLPTPHGQAMSRRSMHPRLAHMVLLGMDMGAGSEACDLAALLLERDVLRSDIGVPEADIRTRVDVLRGTTVRADVNEDALRRARSESRSCRDTNARPRRAERHEGVSQGVLVALAYPDRIAQRRAGSSGRYLLRNGAGAALEPGQLTPEEYLAVADLEGRSREARIRMAAPLSLAEIETHLGAQIEPEEVISWDRVAGAVAARYRERLGALVLREGPARDPDPERVTAALLQGIREMGLRVLPWTGAAQSIRDRVAFLAQLESGWPDLSDAALMEQLEGWLGPLVTGMRRLEQLARVDLADALRRRIHPVRWADMEALAPTHVTVPSGSRIAVDYGDPRSPVLAVRLQEIFGWSGTPRVASGRVPLTLHLLSPAGRPVQVTRDLAGFWRTTYFEVRKDLKGRYPRHYWPDDPLTAAPTRRARPRGNQSRE